MLQSPASPNLPAAVGTRRPATAPPLVARACSRAKAAPALLATPRTTHARRCALTGSGWLVWVREQRAAPRQRTRKRPRVQVAATTQEGGRVCHVNASREYSRKHHKSTRRWH